MQCNVDTRLFCHFCQNLPRIRVQFHCNANVKIILSVKRVIWCKSKRNRHHLVYAHFSTIGAGCNFSRAWYWLPVFPCLHRVHILPHLTLVAIFPALGTGCLFSRAWHRVQVFPRLASVSCFPALCTSCMFSRAWHLLSVFLHFAPVAGFFLLF